MKSKLIILMSLLAVIMAGGIFMGCSDDDNGTPMISYVRVTNPGASDSLLVAAGQGQMVAIMGQNLSGVREIWFNDKKATLQANLVTNTTIITRVPSEIPDEVTDKMRVIFNDGYTLIHDFTTDISAPRIARMQNEWVDPGEESVIYGEYFYEPIVIMFPGGVEAELVSVDEEELHFIVPDGAQRGPLTVTSPFGTTETAFWYKDDRNIFASFDIEYSGLWKGSDYVEDNDPVIPHINGNFMRVDAEPPAWNFFEVYGGPKESSLNVETRNIPAGALINPAGYDLKFEINTLKSFVGGRMKLYVGNAANDQLDARRQDSYYEWQANLHTRGEWETVTIPWSEAYRAMKNFSRDSEGYAMFIYFQSPTAVPHNFAMDNFRVVPNTAD